MARPPMPEIGYATGAAGDPAGRSVEMAIWYPIEPPHPDRRVAASAAPGGIRTVPLVLLSHGRGGGKLDHADTAKALASAGFVAVAPTHPEADNPPSLTHRVRDLEAVVAELRTRPWPGFRIDPRRIGGYGFDLGGATVLAWAAGRSNSSLARCHADQASAQRSAAGCRPPQVRALVLAAPTPALSPGVAPWQRVGIPVQLWHVADDPHSPESPGAEDLRGALAVPPDYHRVENATRFVFLAVCREHAGRIDARCPAPSSFDTPAFHDHFNREVVRFFRAHLMAAPIHPETEGGIADQ